MIPEATNQELLHGFEAFGHLDEDKRARLQASAVPFHLKRGQVAFDVGSPCSAFTLITEGWVNVVKAAPTGREILLYRVEPGQTCVLTLNCLIENLKYPARGIAVSECYGAAVPRLLLSRSAGAEGGSVRVTHQELADELGSVREIVSRILGSFADREMVRLDRGQIRILDVEALKAISGSR